MGANGYDRTYHSDPYERTYSNIPRGYERPYSYVPPPGYERTYNFDPYERTYSNDGHYPSQHDKYPPMKPHDPKYPSHKTPKPSAWKKEKTPKPTWHKEEKTPKPTKADKTPKPTVWKTPRPTKAEKTPKPIWHKDERTPKPTVWKSDHDDKEPNHYSINEEEEEHEGGDLQNFYYFGGGGCSVRLGGACTNSPFGSSSGECCSGCCENGRCVRRRRDWANFLYCPNECRGEAFGALGTCDPLPPINN